MMRERLLWIGFIALAPCQSGWSPEGADLTPTIEAPEDLEQGEEAAIHVTVENIGGEDAVAPFVTRLSFYLDEELTDPAMEPVEWEQTVDLESETSVTYDLVLRMEWDDPVGPFYLHVEVDPEDVLEEGLEANNDDLVVIEILPGTGRDLSITIWAPSDVTVGVPFNITYTVSSEGIAPTPNTYVDFWLLDGNLVQISYLGRVPIDTLNAGQAVNGTYDATISPPLASGVYSILGAVDQDELINESAESNNAWYQTVYVW